MRSIFYLLSGEKVKSMEKKKFFFHGALFRVKLIFKVHAYSIKFGSLNIAVEVEK